MKRLFPSLLLFMAFLIASCAGKDLDLSKVTVVYDGSDHPLVAQMAQTLADDIERVSGVRPKVAQGQVDGPVVFLGTAGQSSLVDDVDALAGKWETYRIKTSRDKIEVTGSDPRGLAYGVFHISEAIGVSPWYWWADVPVKQNANVKYGENFISDESSSMTRTGDSRHGRKETSRKISETSARRLMTRSANSCSASRQICLHQPCIHVQAHSTAILTARPQQINGAS